MRWSTTLASNTLPHLTFDKRTPISHLPVFRFSSEHTLTARAVSALSGEVAASASPAGPRARPLRPLPRGPARPPAAARVRTTRGAHHAREGPDEDDEEVEHDAEAQRPPA